VNPKTEKALPQFVRDLISSSPRRGGNLHNWLFRAALALHRYRTDSEILQLLASATAGEPLQPREIENAIASSKNVALQQRGVGGMVPQPSRPKFDPALRASLIADGGTMGDLMEASPEKLAPGAIYTEQIIDTLFPGDPLLCCGWSKIRFDTRTRSQWRGKLSGMQLIVPTGMKARRGMTQQGRPSARCLKNTGPRRFLVIEFDAGTYDEQAGIILNLGTYLPLVMAVYSGNKSMQAWFFVSGENEKLLEQRFMAYAIRLGADPATWTACQFVRMPDGLRDNGNRQTVYFFNRGAMR
jgi:hypothetical protein